MRILLVPDWECPSTLTKTFDSMVNLWHRVAPDRSALSLLEDMMLAVAEKNEDYGFTFRAKYWNH